MLESAHTLLVGAPATAPSRLAAALCGYGDCLRALAEGRGARPLVECDAIAWALVAQEERARTSPAFELAELSAFRTGGSRYSVRRVDGALVVTRRSRSGEVQRLRGVSIAPQRVVRGAPVVLLDAAGACFTGRVHALELRDSASACGSCS